MRGPPTSQRNRRSSHPLRPSSVRRRTTRLRAASSGSTHRQRLSRLCRRQCARRHRALALDAPSNGVRERSWRKGKGRGEARKRPVLRRNPIGRRFPRKSRLPPRRLPPCFAAHCKVTETGLAGLFTLLKLNCWGQGKEEIEGTRRRCTDTTQWTKS